MAAESRNDQSSKPKKIRKKKFLNQDDALQLAMTIGESIESTSLHRAEKHSHEKQQMAQPREDRRSRTSTSKVKLKETKALLAARRARTKKEHAKLRKQRESGGVEGSGIDSRRHSVPGTAEDRAQEPVRKRVSFA